jgi:RNA-binding protein YhbY
VLGTPLTKIKFAELKEQKKELTPILVEKTSSHLIHRVGNVVVLYRQQPDPAKQRVRFD